MMQIHSKPDEFPLEHIKLQIDDPDLDIATAGEMLRPKPESLLFFIILQLCLKSLNFVISD